MLGDLRAKLTTVGRLDLMGAVDAKAMTYFASLDPRDLSDRTLEEQARALTGMGQVRLDAGDHDAAMAAFREAHTRSTALRKRDTGNGQRLYDLAQAEYWIGFVAFRQDRLEDAQKWFLKYRDSAIALAAMDRGNFDWQREMAYAHGNLAVLDESRGRYAQAEQAMAAQLDLYRTWTAQRPRDPALRFDAANTASWLGSLAMRQGRLADADAYFSEQVAAIRQNLVDEPDNAKWHENSIDALVLLADAQALRGRVGEAKANVDVAASTAAALLAQDPVNNGWRLALAGCRLWQAQLASAGDPSAATHAAAAAALLARARATEPENTRLMRGVVRARNVQARLALARGDIAAAREHLSAALALIEPAFEDGQNESDRLWLARTWLLKGDVAQRDGKSTEATAAWGAVQQLMRTGDGGEIPFDRLDPLIRAMDSLGQSTEAAAHRQRLHAVGYVPLRAFATVQGAR